VRSNPLLAIVGNPPHDVNPTKAEDLLEEAIRPCMTREEAHRAASSIERSLAAVKRHKVVPERVRGKIVRLVSQARGSKTPKGRIRALSAANRMLAQLRTYGAGSKRPSKGYRRRRPERADPRLGHLLHGPELGPEALARRRAYESEIEIAANPEGDTRRLLKRDLGRIKITDEFGHRGVPLLRTATAVRRVTSALRAAGWRADSEPWARAKPTLGVRYTKSLAGGQEAVVRVREARSGTELLPVYGRHGPLPVRSNPLLAIVGNPGPTKGDLVYADKYASRSGKFIGAPKTWVNKIVKKIQKFPNVALVPTSKSYPLTGQRIDFSFRVVREDKRMILGGIPVQALVTITDREAFDPQAFLELIEGIYKIPKVAAVSVDAPDGTFRLLRPGEKVPFWVKRLIDAGEIPEGATYENVIESAGPGRWVFGIEKIKGKNPGPPGGRGVDPRAFMARDRYRADLEEPGHQDAAEYWRGQAGAFFTMNPGIDHHRRAAMDLIHRSLEDEDFRPLRQAHEHLQAAYRCCSNPPSPDDAGVLDEVLAELDAAEGVLFAGLERAAGKRRKASRKAVAGSGKRGSVKGKGRKRVQSNFKAKTKTTGKPRKKRYSLEEARKKFKGFDKAIKAYRKFHDREPGHVDVYELEDGESAVTVDDVHAALHRTLETNYLVPDGWDSNKNGSYWKHEHIEGAMDGKIDLQGRIEDLPLEVFDVKRNRTIKLPNGRWYLTDWWRERKGRGEHRRH
jgi:hypothetical protein